MNQRFEDGVDYVCEELALDNSPENFQKLEIMCDGAFGEDDFDRGMQEELHRRRRLFNEDVFGC